MKNTKSIYLGKTNALFVVYFLLLLVTCSPLANGNTYRQMQGIIPYLNLIYIALGCIKILNKNSIKQALLFFVVIASLLAISFLNGSSMGSISALLTLLLGMYYTSNVSYTHDFLRIFADVGFVYNLIALVKCKSYYQNWDISQTGINPNLISVIVLFFTFIDIIYLQSFYKNNFSLKVIIFLYYILAAICLYMYKSRTCIAAFALFLIFKYLISSNVWINTKIVTIFTLIVICLGIFFPVFYISAPASLVSFVEKITNKPFYSGRNIIWSKFFLALSNPKNLIIGPGSKNQAMFTMLGTKEFSMHNSYLGIMLNFGLIGILLTAIVITYHINRMATCGNRKISTDLIIAIECILFIGYAEEILVDPYIVMFINIIIGIAVQSDRGMLGSFLHESSSNYVV